MGVEMEETMMSRITEVKSRGSIIPTANPFWETIRATSPLVIMPTPTFRESALLNRQIFAIRPQPTILVIRPTKIKAAAPRSYP